MLLSGVAEVQRVHGKGFGIVALRQIQKGERILSDVPILSLSKDQFQRCDSHLQEFLVSDSLSSEVENVIRSALTERSTTDQELFWSLYDPYASGEKTAVGIWLSNSIGLGSEEQHVGVMAIGSRFNHSCTPNVCYSWQERSAKLVFHATSTIETMQELTISYVPLTWKKTQRQTKLHQLYKFTCQCMSCSLSSQTLLLSDHRRTKIAILAKHLNEIVQDVDMKAKQAHVFFTGVR